MSESLSEIELKQISQLVYLDVKGTDSTGLETALSRFYSRNKNEITVGDLIDYYTAKKGGRFEYTNIGVEKIKERFPGTLNGRNEYEYWNELLADLDKPEYRNWKITNVDSKNGKEESGFVAFTVETTGGAKVAAFRGSEPLEDPLYRNDWKNNGTTAYELESRQQADARNYMNNFNQKYSKNPIFDLYLTGHSLGGNLALYSSFILPDELRAKLVSASTFNAPGFNGDVLNKYKHYIDEMIKNGQISEFRNKYDIVPALFKNPTKGIYIDTLSEGEASLDHHSMFSLKMKEDGSSFIQSKSQSRALVANLVHNITVGLEVVPNFIKEQLITEIFKIWDGRIELKHILFAAAAVALVITVGPVAALVGALKAVLALYVIGYVIDTLIPMIKEGVANIAEGLKAFYHESVAYIKGLVDDAIKAANLIGSKIAEFQQQVKGAVSKFFTDLKDGFNKFVADTIVYVKAKWDKLVGLKDKAVKKMVEIFESVKSTIRKKKDEFIANVQSFKDKVISSIKAKIIKTVAKIAVAAAGVARSAKILANLDRLEGLLRTIQRRGENIAEIINRALSQASNVSSTVGRSYGESYVQSGIRDVQSATEEVRTEKRRMEETLNRRITGINYSIAKYREIEHKIAIAARMAAPTIR
ncbi:hypothetical protein FHS15_002638 [Paenibacillus castaneae]|uniref:Mbeg1-like protein n=1 Tax=Paenibacillus castaneae TaxID=474957 RepID=UPI000C9A2738|nr:Mbeg1-like protein [Paenibacillus castaneae]NIK77502.1 hypothetical protein [Paenibacillus castaneae]